MPNPLDVALCDLLDRMVGDLNLDSPDFALTSTGYDWWLANHGFPETANDLRSMFEFAARMESFWVEFLRRQGVQV